MTSRGRPNARIHKVRRDHAKFHTSRSESIDWARGAALARPAEVDCRIHVTRGPRGVVVHLAGGFREAQVAAFLETCVKEGLPLHIDLNDLLSADTVAIDALVRVREMGAELERVPQYLQLKIESRSRARFTGPRAQSKTRRRRKGDRK